MSEEIREGIEKLPIDSLDPEMRGTVVDLQESTRSAFWLAGGLIALIGILFASWAALYMTRTEEEILIERLNHQGSVASMIREAHRAIDASHIRAPELEESIELAIHASTTALRVDENPRSPYIRERYDAMIVALEGLLRLELEFPDDSKAKTRQAFLFTAIETLGLQELEFFENGILNQEPLIQTASLRARIKEEKSNKAADPGELEELRAQLRQVMQEESFSVAGAALNLGRWYRFQNELDQAERCFHIARRYVAGYPGPDGWVEGKNLETLDSLWEVYVEGIESLAELHFQNREYRMARVYLSQIFTPPNNTQNLLDRHKPRRFNELSSPQIDAVKEDILLLKEAMATPLELPSFPYFSSESPHLNWSALIQALATAQKGEEAAPRTLVWNKLSKGQQENLEQHFDQTDLPVELRQELILHLNSVVRSPSFAAESSFPEEKLSRRSQSLLQQGKKRVLSDEERAFLNREILTNAFGEAFPTRYTLSDGTPLHNALDSEQRNILFELYEQALADETTPEVERRAILNHRRQLLDGATATLSDFDHELWRQVEQQQRSIVEADETLREQEQALIALQEELKELEQAEGLAVNRALKLNEKQQFIASQREAANERKERAQKQLNYVQEARSLLTVPLFQRLQQAEAQLAALTQQEERLLEQRMRDSGALLSQVEKQIALRKQYLELLEGLKTTNGGKELQRLAIERQRLEGEVAVLRQQASLVSGDEREIIDFEVSQLQGQLHLLVQAFDELFTPLRKTVDEIREEEQKIWEAERLLRQTHDDILALIGTEEVPGSLEEKAARRKKLLMMKADDILNAPLYDDEIKNLNNEIANNHAKLHLLLETETLARETLHTFYPHLSDTPSLIYNNGDLAALVDSLSNQEELMNSYETLWQEKELLAEIYQQEKAIVENLHAVSTNLEYSNHLSEQQTRDLTRYVENILQAKNQLDAAKILLRQIHQAYVGATVASSISGSGYLLDNVDMFQIEHEMGLSLNEYRLAFEERANIVAKLKVVLIEKENLQKEKLTAVRERDQQKIDSLIPKVAEKESAITFLSQKEGEINHRLRQLGVHFEDNLEKVRNYRDGISSRVVEIEESIATLAGEMSEADEQLHSLVSEIFSTAAELRRSVTTIKIDDLSGLDTIIAHEKRELSRLLRIQEVKQKENFFKAKALYLVGRSFYEESRLESLSDLRHSFNLDDRLWPELKPFYHALYPEFEKGSFYTDEVLISIQKEDKAEIHYETWVTFLEENALKVFQKDLPQYLLNPGAKNENMISLAWHQQKDNDVFIANSRFLSGEVFVKRALRQVRASRALPQDNGLARAELNKATTAFLGYLDFAEPLAYAEKEEQLTAIRMGSQEFPSRRRHPISRIDEARIYLGIAAGLRSAHHEAIGYYRDLLQSAAARLPERTHIEGEEGGKVLGQVDPVLLETVGSRYTPQLYPFYASLLSHNNMAHEALYRLARSYESLTQEEYQQGLENSSFFFVNHEENFERAEIYANRSVAYFSQLIQTQAYSPYRKAALLQRALLRKQFGSYHEAREDLVSILGTPGDKGGSWDFAEMSPKGDLPGELNPSYAHVSFELGKLHLENQNFAAATEAFFKAKEGDPSNTFVLQAKIAYAETLVKSKNWLMANLLLSELVDEMEEREEETLRYFHLDLFVQLAHVQKELGNFVAAKETLIRLLKQVPQELVREESLDLSNPYGLAVLETDYRDTIRQLATAMFTMGEIHRHERQYALARDSFAQAEKLYHMIPWREDRTLRSFRKAEFQSYREEKVLLCQWEQLKTDSLGLLFSSFSDYRSGFELAQRTERKMLTSEIIEQVDAALQGVDGEHEQFVELYSALNNFYQNELQSLPEERERRRITQQRELERRLGSKSVLTYDALRHIREVVLQLKADSNKPASAQRIVNRFTKGTLERELLNEFVLLYAQQITLTREDRMSMLETRSNLENLLAIDQAESRLASMGDQLLLWSEQRMQQTGLDDLFIAVSPQAQILEEVDLYRVSLLSHLDTQHYFQEMKGIADRYIDEAKKKPNRISRPQIAWQLVEIAAMTAEFQTDWEASERYFRYLLSGADERFFLANTSDRQRAELSLANSLIRLSQKSMGDLLFLQNPTAKIKQQLRADQMMEEAKGILRRLSETEGENSQEITTRIRAKQILSEVGV